MPSHSVAPVEGQTAVMEERPQWAKPILIVDDEAGTRGSLAEILEREAFHVIAVCNGREALRYLRQCAELPVLILLDMLVPEVSGVEFLSRQRHEPALAMIPVVAMSDCLYLAQQTHVLGAADYLVKPFDAAELLSTITRILWRRQGPAPEHGSHHAAA